MEYLLSQNFDKHEHFENALSLEGYFTLYFHFRGQRFKSRPFPCVCEPQINQEFLFEISIVNESSLISSPAILLSISDPIHIVMIKTDRDHQNHLISSYFLEWRDAIANMNNKKVMSIELLGTGAENKIPVGILNIILQLKPTLDETVNDDLLAAQLGIEHSKVTEK